MLSVVCVNRLAPVSSNFWHLYFDRLLLPTLYQLILTIMVSNNSLIIGKNVIVAIVFLTFRTHLFDKLRKTCWEGFNGT